MKIEDLAAQVAALDVDEVAGERLAEAVNAELERIYRERRLSESWHRVPHQIKETREAPGPKGITRTNHRDDCPDCHRSLVAARDDDAPFHVLVCGRLHGLSLAGVAGLTPHDIVACGAP